MPTCLLLKFLFELGRLDPPPPKKKGTRAFRASAERALTQLLHQGVRACPFSGPGCPHTHAYKFVHAYVSVK